MITPESFKRAHEIDLINDLMEDTCTIATLSPKTVYRFMLRFVYYCRSYSFLVARLAGVIGSSHLFNAASSPYRPHGERSMDVAASVLSAAIEEFRDPRIGVSHRTMSYGLLDRLAQYAGLTDAEVQQIVRSGTWLDEILQAVDRGYSADPNDISSMVRAMGFHVGAETVGALESAVIHKIIFAQQKGTEFDRFIRQHKLTFPGGKISPTYWVAVHGTQHSVGVEADHAEDAIGALNKVIQYNDVTAAQVVEWADAGFAHFNRTQIAFFQKVKQELHSELHQQHSATQAIARF